MKKLLFVILVSLLINSCAISRYHEFGKTPDKSGNYPSFRGKDYLIGQLDVYRAGYDVTFYDMDLNLDPNKKMLGGEVAIHFRALDKLKTIRIDLNKNLHINSLKLSEKEIPFLRNDRAVIASLPDTLVIGRNYILTVGYEGKPIISKIHPGAEAWFGKRTKTAILGLE